MCPICQMYFSEFKKVFVQIAKLAIYGLLSPTESGCRPPNNCRIYLSILPIVFVQIATCISLNLKTYLSKLPNVFLWISKHSCPNCKTSNLWPLLANWKWPLVPNNFASVSYSQTQSPDFPNPGLQIFEYSFFPLKLLSGSNRMTKLAS